VKARVLVVDDDDGVRFTLRGILEDEGLDVTEAADGRAALARLDEGRFDLVISDLRMPELDGLGLLRAVRARPEPPRVILVTAHGSERQAVAAMREGAHDYFRKPFDTDELLAVVRRAVEAARLADDNRRLTGELLLARSLLFVSAPMQRLAELVQRVAPRDVTVLIAGESGVGKERVAEALVAGSKRARRPFVRFNCAAIPAELVEAELFGHAKGAFTGAARDRPGLFREADGGTLLLDEVGELAPAAQAALLRALASGEVRPVGEDRAIHVDVRVLAATHRDLEAMVRAGTFREDLWYRLRVVHLGVPPLRDRKDDLPVLAREFLRRAAERFGVPAVAPGPALLAALAAHDWPGNVRELEHALESLVALSADGDLDLSLLPGAPRPIEPVEDESTPLRTRLEAYERGLIVAALAAAGGSRVEAARRLGIGRATLHEKMVRYGVK
jgi:two-component system response regulator HydG